MGATAVLAMGEVPGFEKQILEALESDAAALRFEAIRAAGRAEVGGAWRHLKRLVGSETADRTLGGDDDW